MPFQKKRDDQAITKEHHVHSAVGDHVENCEKHGQNDDPATLPDQHLREEEVNEDEVNVQSQNGDTFANDHKPTKHSRAEVKSKHEG